MPFGDASGRIMEYVRYLNENYVYGSSGSLIYCYFVSLGASSDVDRENLCRSDVSSITMVCLTHESCTVSLLGRHKTLRALYGLLVCRNFVWIVVEF